jgi:excisionase family DNA binding protein
MLTRILLGTAYLSISTGDVRQLEVMHAKRINGNSRRPSVKPRNRSFSLQQGGAVMEGFVTAHEAARFLAITKRRVLELAREGQLPAHPIGNGERKTWRFRLSELADSLQPKKPKEAA